MMLSKLKNMSKSVRYTFKALILLAYPLILLVILHSHYVEIGECAARVYYYPLWMYDYFLIPLVGIVLLSISLYFIPTFKRLCIIEVFIYASIAIATLLLGNDILASRTVDWPDMYKVEKL